MRFRGPVGFHYQEDPANFHHNGMSSSPEMSLDADGGFLFPVAVMESMGDNRNHLALPALGSPIAPTSLPALGHFTAPTPLSTSAKLATAIVRMVQP